MDATVDDNEFFEQFVNLASGQFSVTERTQLGTATRKNTAEHIVQLIERAFEFLTNEVEEARPSNVPKGDTAPHSIPSIGAFHGRLLELAECHRRIDENKVVEVTGMSGIGKTRLLLKAINERLADGRIAPDAFIYFDCACGMRTENAADVFFAKLGGFAKRTGCSEADFVAILSPHQSVVERISVVVKLLETKPCLLFIDNLQEALEASGRLVSSTFKAAMNGLLDAQIGPSRIVIGTFIKWSDPHRVDPDTWEFPMVSPMDAKVILKEMCALTDEALLDAAIRISDGHTYTLKLFVALANEIGSSVSTVVSDLVSKRSEYAESKFREIVGEAFMNNLWSRLSPSTSKVLSAAAVVRQPASVELLSRMAGLGTTEAHESIAQALKCHLLDSANTTVRYSIHQLPRAHALSFLSNESLAQLNRTAAVVFMERCTSGSAIDGIEAHYHLMQYDEGEAETYRGDLSKTLDDLGKQSWSTQLYEESLKAIEWRLKYDPADASAVRHKANTLARLGRPEAGKWFRKALELGEKLSHVWTAYARFLLNNGNVDLAEHFLTLAKSKDPKNSRIIKDLAQARLLLGTPLSNDEWKAAIEADRDNVAMRNMYATELWREGRGVAAILQWKRAIQHRPGNPFAYTQLADRLLSMKRESKAVELWETCCALVPGDAAVRNDYARYLRRTNPQRAIDLWKEAIALGSQHSINDYARFLVHVGMGDKAEKVWRDAIEQNRNNPVHRNNLARHLAASDDINNQDEAEILWRQNIDANPLHTHSRNSYAAFLEKLGHYREADAQWSASVQVDPNAEYARNDYALYLVKQNRFEEAEQQWERAVKNKNHVVARNAWASFLIKRSRNSVFQREQRVKDRLKAIALWEEVRQVEPHEPFMVADYATCLMRLPDPNKKLAEELLAGALVEHPNNERLIDSYARLLMSKGSAYYSAAEDLFKRGILVNPKNTHFRGGYATLLDYTGGREKEAWEQLQVGLRWAPDNRHLLHKQSRFHTKGYPFLE
jgi:tetratricopeptide (TPR) repeat protein